MHAEIEMRNNQSTVLQFLPAPLQKLPICLAQMYFSLKVKHRLDFQELPAVSISDPLVWHLSDD